MRPQRGQALAELALIAPLFAVLLLLFSYWAHLAVTRLALIQMSRDATLMVARNGTLWNQPQAMQQSSVRRFAQRQSILDPSALELSFEAVAPMGLGRVEGLGSILNSPLGSKIHSWSGLRRYRLRYKMRIGGLAGRMVGSPIVMEESLVVMGDPWKMDFKRLMERVL